MNTRPLTKEEITVKVKEVLKDGNWMIRRSDNGRSYEGFQWNPIGVWTEAPDWDPKPECGGGLHGCNQKSGGFYTGGRDVDFCMIGDEWTDIYGEKIKCRWAMVLMRNELPNNLNVDGSLDLSHTNIVQLPDNLNVGRSLDLNHTNITQLPDNLRVDGNLNLCHTNITQLPDNLSVGGFLNLNHTNVTQLPSNLNVGGWLDLSHTKITQLPDNLSVDGWLDLSHTKITQLPSNLSVHGDLDLRYTDIIQVPDNLSIDDNLYLDDINIVQLPDNLTIGGRIIDRIEYKGAHDGYTAIDQRRNSCES